MCINQISYIFNGFLVDTKVYLTSLSCDRSYVFSYTESERLLSSTASVFEDLNTVGNTTIEAIV